MRNPFVLWTLEFLVCLITVIGFWRGLWVILDSHLLTNEDLLVQGPISMGIGLVAFLLFHSKTYIDFVRTNSFLKTKSGRQAILIIQSVLGVVVWRGAWYTLDGLSEVLFDDAYSETWGWITMGFSIVVLFFSSQSDYLTVPPYPIHPSTVGLIVPITIISNLMGMPATEDKPNEIELGQPEAIE